MHTHVHVGLIVLLGSGVHTVWAFWQIYSSDPIPTSIIKNEYLMIGSWYISTIIGTVVAAAFISTWSKKRLYVSLQYTFYHSFESKYGIGEFFDHLKTLIIRGQFCQFRIFLLLISKFTNFTNSIPKIVQYFHCLMCSISHCHPQLISAVVLFISSLFFIAQITLDFRYDTVLLVGRILGGLANGLAYLTVITHAAENAVNQIRGIILRGIGYVLAFSLFIAGATTSKYLSWHKTTYVFPELFDYANETKELTQPEAPNKIYNDFETEFIMGVVNFFYSILAMLAACYLTIESAPHLLRRVNDGLSVAQREALVIATMVKLRSEKGETPKIRSDFIEMKHQLNEDHLDERLPINLKNLRPLLIIIGVRVLSVCAKNLPFSILVMMYFNHQLKAKDIELELLFVLLCCRFFLGMFTMFFIDKFECKKFLYISSILCGFLMLTACIMVLDSKEEDASILTFNPYFRVVIIIFFVFGSMSIDCVGHVQASEAFSYATKSWSITIVNTIEHVVHLLFIFLYIFKHTTLTFVFIALGLIVFGASTLFTVPARTKGLSLRQTRDIYRKVHFTLTRGNV